MHNNLPAYFSTMKPTLPTVCSRYEIRTLVFHLPYTETHFLNIIFGSALLSY